MILLSGCMSEKAVITKHYTIEWPENRQDDRQDDRQEADGENDWLVPGRCEIDQVEISPLYEKTQIVNRSDSHEITYYRYHQWAIRPSLAVMEVVRTYLESAGMFESVSSRYSRAIPDFHFTTNIRQLEVIENKNQFMAHLQIKFSLVRNSNDSTLIEHRADRTEPLNNKDLNLFAATISDMLVSELMTFEDLFRTQLAELKESE